MKFKSLKQCIKFLENDNELIIIDQDVDPDLEMAHITRRVFENSGPALLFTRVKGSRFPALSNLMGTWQRTLKIFEPQLQAVKALADLRSDPGIAVRSPASLIKALPAAVHAVLLRKTGAAPVLQARCRITDLPMVRCWPRDGGAFVLLPQVFSMNPLNPSVLSSNLGMYRIQLSGNQYRPGEEIGLHYQIHRGIGNHQQNGLESGLPYQRFYG